jgi:uncharacterized protein (TIGR03435 family)
MIRTTLAAILTGAVSVLSAQVAPNGPAFEVASVQRNESGTLYGGVGLRPGGYAATNALLRTMIVHAYRLKRNQVLGGPAWIDAERFDVQARALDGTSEDDLFRMTRAMLAERFKLVTHTEVRELPVYLLVRARSNGRLGPQLKLSIADCSSSGNPCGMYATSFGDKGGAVTTKGRSMDDLAAALGGMLDRTVLNRTGVTGAYEIELKWGAEVVNAAPATDDAPPMLATAIHEQLGLKLEAGRGPVEVLIIDSVERPSPN